MPVTANPQISIAEQVVEDDELEAALEARERAKVAAGAAQKTYREHDETAKAMIRELELEPGALVRCGRFVVATTEVAARAVAFETSPTTRITIAAGDGGDVNV